jgi:hypothetical protein
LPLPLGTAARAQHEDLSDSQAQESDGNAFERLPPPNAERPSEPNVIQSDHDPSDWLPAPDEIAEHGSVFNAIRSEDDPSNWLPAPGPIAEQHDPSASRLRDFGRNPSAWLPAPDAERPSEANTMQSQGRSHHHLPERPRTPNNPIVPQDFKEGSRSETANRVECEETTEDWKSDITERPKPSRTTDQAILPQKHNESDHVELVDRRAQKAKREKDAKDRKAETVSGDSRTADTAILPQEINESGHREFVDRQAEKAKREEEMSDLSGWTMTSN